MIGVLRSGKMSTGMRVYAKPLANTKATMATMTVKGCRRAKTIGFITAPQEICAGREYRRQALRCYYGGLDGWRECGSFGALASPQRQQGSPCWRCGLATMRDGAAGWQRCAMALRAGTLPNH